MMKLMALQLLRAWTAAYVFFTAYALFSIDIDALVGDKLLRQLNV